MGAALAVGAGVGALGGIISGASGTPDQRTSQTSQTTFAPASQQERDLQAQSLQNYLQQLQLANQYEQGIGGAQGMQDMARQQQMNIMNGSAMQATPQEMANIQALRQSMMAQGTNDIQQAFTSGLQQSRAGAASRGLRGQAQQQMEGDVLRGSGQAMTALTNQANQAYAQNVMNAPYQRIAAQSPFLAQNASLADQMRMQAQMNRQSAQSPYLLGLLNNERMKSGITTTTGTQYGQQGSLGGALMGGLAGGAMGLGAAGAGIKGWNDFSTMNSLGGGGNKAGSGLPTNDQYYNYYKS